MRNEDALVLRPPLFAVADGMGGARAGEIAARLAAAALEEADIGTTGERAVSSLIEEANRRIWERSLADPATSGHHGHAFRGGRGHHRVAVGHVGDSRAVLIREYKLEQLTEDHSLLNDYIKMKRLTAEEIARVLIEFGEERHAHRIARALVEQRRRAPVRTAADLVSVVKRAVPRAAWSRRTHVATRTFQAVRMAVNDEPGALAEALPQAAALLEDGGRLGVISFHSGEDRVVKRAFRSLAGRGFVELEPTPVTAGREETTYNPRARSAKLRVLARQEAA